MSAEEEAEDATQRDARREDSHGERATPRGEIIGHQRGRRRPVRRLADAHQRAAGKELAEAVAHYPPQITQIFTDINGINLNQCNLWLYYTNITLIVKYSVSLYIFGRYSF